MTGAGSNTSIAGWRGGPRRRRILSTLIVVFCIVFCGGFWITRPDAETNVLGRYSLQWFSIAVAASATALLVTRIALRSLLAERVSAETSTKRLSLRKRVAFVVIILSPVVIGAELWLRHLLAEAARASTPSPQYADSDFHALLQVADRMRVDGKWHRSYRERRYAWTKTRRFRIVCLGGSTTWGTGLRAEETWPRMLEQRFLQAGYDVEVLNAGKPWYTTAHSLVNYVLTMRYYDPDIVIAMHGVNDLYRSFPGEDELPPEWDYGSYRGPMRDLLKMRKRKRSGEERDNVRPEMPVCAIWKFVCAATDLDRKYYSALRRHRDPSRNPASERRSGSARSARLLNPGPLPRLEDEVDVDLEKFVTLESFRAHLGFLADVCVQDGRLVVLSTQAHIYNQPREGMTDAPPQVLRTTFFRPTPESTVSPASMRRAMRAVRDVVYEVAREHGSTAVDCETAIDGRPTCFIDDFHLSSEGNAIVAKAMFDVIRPLLDDIENKSKSRSVVPVLPQDGVRNQ